MHSLYTDNMCIRIRILYVHKFIFTYVCMQECMCVHECAYVGIHTVHVYVLHIRTYIRMYTYTYVIGYVYHV